MPVHDFTETETVYEKTCGMVFGDPGTGKTTFVCKHCPGPIAFINFDGRASRVVESSRKGGKKILFTSVKFPSKRAITRINSYRVKKLGSECVEKVLRNLEWAFGESVSGNIGTVCLDTSTEFSHLLAYAIRGRLDLDKGDYGASKGVMNQQVRTVFEMARESEANFIVLSRAKTVWMDKEPTDVREPVGNSVFVEECDWVGNISVQDKRPMFSIKMTKSGDNIKELSKVYTSDDWRGEGPFVHVCMKQYPGTNSDDWKENTSDERYRF